MGFTMPTYYSNIIELLEDIKQSKLLLPMIQRPFVWTSEDRIERFFDSLIAGYPIGIILLYKISRNEKLKIFGREFFKGTIDNEELKKSWEFSIETGNNQHLVLDGQQRLQSLYIGYYGNILMNKRLYYNLLFETNERMKGVSSFEFKPYNKNEAIYMDENGNQNLYVLFSKVAEFSEKMTGIGDDVDEKEVVKNSVKDFLKDNGIDNNLIENNFEKIFARIEHLNNTVLFKENNRLFSTLVIENKKFGDVLEIFVRFNQGGLTLTRSDLIFSILQLNWKEAGKQINHLSDKTNINKDLLLKSLIIISDYPAQTQIYELKEKVEVLKSNFPTLENIILEFNDRVNQLTELTGRIYRKFNFLIPLIRYFYLRPDKLKEPVLENNIIKYILIIVYNSNLRSDTHINKIINIINNNYRKGSFPIKEILIYLKGRVQTNIDENSLNSDPLLTFSLIQRNNWKPLYYSNRLHIDHIFPISKVKLLPEKSQDLIDTIWNKYVVFQGDNIRKSQTLPEEYFKDKPDYLLERYFIKKELLPLEKFEELIEYRRNIICNSFKENFDIEIDDY